jgi:hypothetical protein
MPPPCKGRETSSLVAAAAVFHGPRSAGQSLEGKRDYLRAESEDPNLQFLQPWSNGY